MTLTADEASEYLDEMAREEMKKNPKISFEVALFKVAEKLKERGRNKG